MNKLSAILSVIGLISTIGLILFFVPLMNERSQEAQERLDNEIEKLDQIINKNITYCITSSDSRCEQVMLDWLEECKKEDLAKIPSCHDGRIIEYLKNNPPQSMQNQFTSPDVTPTNP